MCVIVRDSVCDNVDQVASSVGVARKQPLSPGLHHASVCVAPATLCAANSAATLGVTVAPVTLCVAHSACVLYTFSYHVCVCVCLTSR